MTNHPNRKRRVMQTPLQQLIAAAKMSLRALENMTSEQFSLGSDREARNALRAALDRFQAADEA